MYYSKFVLKSPPFLQILTMSTCCHPTRKKTLILRRVSCNFWFINPTSSVKPHEQVQSGAFVEMGDLVPTHLGFDENTGTKSKDHSITHVSEWLQAFSVYVSVIAKKQPGCVYTRPDMIANPYFGS